MVASFEITSESWQAEARCAETGDGNDIFFSEELQDIAQAKAICATCAVIAPCLGGAIERREPWGVWGGQLFMNGKVLMVKRRRGRPPKVPRPSQVDPCSRMHARAHIHAHTRTRPTRCARTHLSTQVGT